MVTNPRPEGDRLLFKTLTVRNGHGAATHWTISSVAGVLQKLEDIFKKGKSTKVQSSLIDRISRRLDVIDTAKIPEAKYSWL